MNNHVNAVCKSVHIHVIRHIPSSVSDDVAKMIACVFFGARLDYTNSILFGTTQKNISILQKAQNYLALTPILLDLAVHVLSSSSSTGQWCN